ncbi:F-actin-capping protein subunit alpha [Leucosporidium creatinivorum]|uniref:F-actin-capping protein subunit alpha n=1 Tax=Leucosporidium creatinivorum TaxID=106004 RepID=A0A1Y2EXK4_9BASI|nr:F-actin-capping protein subunit alpha [Leucosporidium creatinivorum]
MSSQLEQRLSAASTFLLQSPPGEVNDVFADVRTIVGDDAALESGILPALEQYNTEQFIVVDLEGDKVLITEASKLKGEVRHVDPKGQRTFAFDHMKVAASDPQPLEVDTETESIRSSIEKVLAAHVSNHYSEGASAVYALEDSNYPEPEPVVATPVEETKPEPEVEEAPVVEETAEEKTPAAEEEGEAKGVEEGEEEKPEADADADADAVDESKPIDSSTEEDKAKPMETTPAPAPAPAPPAPRPSRIFGLYFVGTKYNPSNYWTGKWRSVYVADFEKGTFEGKALVNVHYYEQGNVQLSTTLTSTSPLPSSTPTAESLIALLKSSESSFAAQLSDAYSGLSDEQFRGLRRALPRTRTKVDWAKIVNYRLSKELGGGAEA